MSNRPASPGFTLIEMIMVILLLSIVGLVGGEFISQAFRGFAGAENRMEIYEEGKIALVRMEREIHNGIPNAFNPASPTDLQFGMIDEPAMRSCFGQYTNNNPKNFIRDQLAGLPVGSIISIYNTSWSQFTMVATPRTYEVTNTVGTKMDVEGGSRDIQADSPTKRFYAVDQAVRYCLDGQRLYRDAIAITNANYESGISFPAACSGKVLATSVSGLSFSYQPGSATNSPLVTVDLTMARKGESLNFHKEIMITNVP